MEFNQLFPDHAPFEVETRLRELDLASGATDRPYTIANFVSSADGRATFGGRSGQLGDEGDRAMFHGLREQVDAIIVGTGTMRAENYGRVLGKIERRERRLERGVATEPLVCTVTRSGAVPTGIPLFQESDARIVVFTAAEFDPDGCGADVQVVELDPAELTMTTVVRRLRSEFGIASMLCEGGPSMFAALLRERVVDELFLTHAPKLTGGGTGPTITSGPELPELRDLKLIWLLERSGSLFLRYEIP